MFNKFRVYTARNDVLKSLTAELLEEKLALKPFNPCGSQQMKSIGWSSWDEQLTENLVITAKLAKGDHFLLTLKIEERDLKAKVVNEAVRKKVVEIENNESRTVERKEKSVIKEEVMQELMPRALTSSELVFVWIDVAKSRIIVDQTSDSKCEAPLSLLRECLGSLPVVPLNTMKTPNDEMTQWVQGGVPKGFYLGDACTLVDPMVSGNSVTVKGQDLNCDEVLNHIKEGKRVKKLALGGDTQTFSLDEKLTFSGIKLDEAILEEFEDSLGESTEDKQAFFEGTFTLSVDVLQRFIDQTINHLGGVYDPNDAAEEENA